MTFFKKYRKPVAAFVMVAIGAGGLATLVGCGQERPSGSSRQAKAMGRALTSVQETPRSALSLREGRLYYNATTNLFTGLVADRYDATIPKSRSEVSNGLLEGLSEGFYTNGQKQVEEHFHAGVSCGLRTKWYEDGQKCAEANIVDGKIEGVFRRWHTNGVLSQEITMKGNQPDGLSRSYYLSGCLKADATLRGGKVLEQHFWKEGVRSGEAPERISALIPGARTEP
jgi:antitoxin component YwqK of YwqJK toxin-antitoxin module